MKREEGIKESLRIRNDAEAFCVNTGYSALSREIRKFFRKICVMLLTWVT